jgi:hypothetical protein
MGDSTAGELNRRSGGQEKILFEIKKALVLLTSCTKKRPAGPGSCRMTLRRASDPALLPVPSDRPVMGNHAKSAISSASGAVGCGSFRCEAP